MSAGFTGASEPTRFLERPDSARIALYEEGPSDPQVVVVLGHGWQANASIWARVAAGLRTANPGVMTVRYDQRGHGASTRGLATPSIPLLASDLAAILRTVTHTGARAVVAGHSMGGMAVLALAACHPDLIGREVAGAVLAATTAGRLDLSRPGNPPVKRLVGHTRNVMAEFCLIAPRTATRLRHVARPRPYKQAPIDEAARWYRALMEHDVTGRLSGLRAVPVHIVVGELDRHIPPIHALRLAALIPGATMHVVGDADHRLPTRCPGTLQDILQAACADVVQAVRREVRAPVS